MSDRLATRLRRHVERLAGEIGERHVLRPEALHAAERMGVTPEQSMMLGDSMSDVKAARAAGFQIICMSYGYNHGEDIRDYNPDAVIDSMVELRGLLEAAA